jgi:hypothetical protein
MADTDRPDDRPGALPIETIIANLTEARQKEIEFRERERMAEARLDALDVFPVD